MSQLDYCIDYVEAFATNTDGVEEARAELAALRSRMERLEGLLYDAARYVSSRELHRMIGEELERELP